MNWPKESWVLLLQSVLVGKPQEIYGSLSIEQSSKYEHVKEAILKAYKLVHEAYRQNFRNYFKYDSKTHKMSSKSGNPQQKRYHGSGNGENISRNMDDRKRQSKSTENLGLVSKVEPLKQQSCGHCGRPDPTITNC